MEHDRLRHPAEAQPVLVVDLNDAEARMLLAAYDSLTSLATPNAERVYEITRSELPLLMGWRCGSAGLVGGSGEVPGDQGEEGGGGVAGPGCAG